MAFVLIVPGSYILIYMMTKHKIQNERLPNKFYMLFRNNIPIGKKKIFSSTHCQPIINIIVNLVFTKSIQLMSLRDVFFLVMAGRIVSAWPSVRMDTAPLRAVSSTRHPIS